MRTMVVVVFATGLLGLAGCGGGAKFAPVSGRVTLNNQPVAGLQVDFQPVAASKDQDPGPGSTAKTDKDGRFVLHSQLDPSQAGAVVGKHQVRIWAAEGANDADADAGGPKAKKGAGAAIPGRYHVQSTLTFEVPAGGTDKADFSLTSP